MKIFRTNRISFEALKLSIELYRLDKSNVRYFDNITLFAKTIIYNFMIDVSLLLTVFFCVAHYVFQSDRWSAWLVFSVGVYGLNVINMIVHQHYFNNTELSADEKTQGILNNAPRYMFFNDREKEIFYEPVYKKIRGR